MGMDLGKQLGPLPLGAWVVVVGGGLGIAYYSRGMDEGAAGEDYSDYRDTGGPYDVGKGPGWTAIVPPQKGPKIPRNNGRPKTNENWAYRAVRYLVNKGVPAEKADTAVRRYLESKKLSPGEWALIARAIRKLGPVPDLLAATPRPKKEEEDERKFRYHRVMPTDTLASLARKYAGDPRKWRGIYVANRYGEKRADGSPGLIRENHKLQAGWKLIIPRALD